MNTKKGLIPEELFNEPAKIVHRLETNEYGVEKTIKYFGKIVKRNKKTQKLTLRVFLWAERFRRIPDLKNIVVDENDLEISFAKIGLNRHLEKRVYYQKIIQLNKKHIGRWLKCKKQTNQYIQQDMEQ